MKKKENDKEFKNYDDVLSLNKDDVRFDVVFGNIGNFYKLYSKKSKIEIA